MVQITIMQICVCCVIVRVLTVFPPVTTLQSGRTHRAPEMKKLRMALGWPIMMVVLTCAVVAMLPGVSSDHIVVGGFRLWNVNVNYTYWARGKHFYLNDWLDFIYDKNQLSVLEVNETDYESCNADHPLHNWTRIGGNGRDLVSLNMIKTYYIISGNGYCKKGVKVAVTVEKPPPFQMRARSPGLLSTFGGQIVVPVVFAIAAI
ncbi:PREDICTED: lamin-like protein isoform X2 [Ipomoea nil]|uniref:lamin-like protein isoform X2 n=1 Tax=Ipomoea nil TaxID=35883 RepID=UPI0009014812|nr:PREDICTED: lamin-like protein isoform X2 [Ipomoea nil]